MSGGNGAGVVAEVETHDSRRTVEAPQDWDKAVSAAYLWVLDHPVKQVASSVGIDPVTFWAWRNSPWWPLAIQEATQRWLHGLQGKAMDGLKASVSRDGHLALKVLERRIPELAPPKQQVHLEVDLNVKDLRERISDRLRRIAITN